MRSIFVVSFSPLFGHFPHLVQGREEVCVQHFIPVAFVEPFDKRILVGFARLDVTDLDAVFFTPVYEGLGTYVV